MHYQLSGASEDVKVSIIGELTYNDHLGFKEMLSEIEQKVDKNLTVDLGQLEFIDSSGLGLLLLVSDRAKKSGWAIRMVNPVGQVDKMLKYTNIDTQISRQE